MIERRSTPESHYSMVYEPALLPDFLEDWSRHAACHGKWELFDGVRQEAMEICWNECPVRFQCIRSCMEYEASVDAQSSINNDLDVYNHSNNNPAGRFRLGIQGGYKPSERQYIAFALELGASIEEF